MYTNINIYKERYYMTLNYIAMHYVIFRYIELHYNLLYKIKIKPHKALDIMYQILKIPCYILHIKSYHGYLLQIFYCIL